jgi:hypothetical protein
MAPYIKTAVLVFSPLLFMCAILLLVFWPLAALGVDRLIPGGDLYPVIWSLMSASVVGKIYKEWINGMLSYIKTAFLLLSYNALAIFMGMLAGLPFGWLLVLAANAYLAAMAAVLWYARKGD